MNCVICNRRKENGTCYYCVIVGACEIVNDMADGAINASARIREFFAPNPTENELKTQSNANYDYLGDSLNILFEAVSIFNNENRNNREIPRLSVTDMIIKNLEDTKNSCEKTDKNSCAICQDTVQGKFSVFGECMHTFHTKCMAELHASSDELTVLCPICRTEAHRIQ